MLIYKVHNIFWPVLHVWDYQQPLMCAQTPPKQASPLNWLHLKIIIFGKNANEPLLYNYWVFEYFNV